MRLIIYVFSVNYSTEIFFMKNTVLQQF